MQGGVGRFLVGLFLVCSLQVSSQEIKVNGGFVEDSLLIGQDVNFWVTASYPASLEMVFPDSNFNFSPFEYSSKKYFPTKSENDVAFDSTVYTIQSYEIDLVQYLLLPTVILEGKDSTVINTPLDSIFFTELAPMVSDTTKLIANTNYSLVDTQFNFPLFYYVIGGLVALCVILLIIFGKRIIRFFKLRKLRKNFENFSGQLAGYIQKMKVEPEYTLVEEALVFWKKYQEGLDKTPFTKLTTKEILKNTDAKELEKPLMSIDRLVYGKRPTDTVFQDFQQIEDFTQYRYNKKVEEIKGGQEEIFEKNKHEQAEIASTKMIHFGLTEEQLKEELSKGGKFVIYYYTISILVMSFRRTSKVKFLKNGENQVLRGLGYTVVTFLLGWWGIPWGLIYTPHALYVNLRGGKDVTMEILQNAKR